MFNNLFKDKRKLFYGFLGGFTVFIVLFIFNQYTENFTDDAQAEEQVEEEQEEEVDVDPAYKKQTAGSNPVLPVQSASSVGPTNSGQPIDQDPVYDQEPFTEAKTGITTYAF